MRDPNDTQTDDLLPTPRRRGRPRTGTALTSAQKQARYRERLRARSVSVTFGREAVEALELHIRGLVAGHDAPIPPELLPGLLDALRAATQTQLRPVTE
ncbi:hypothetical protein KBAD11_25040 [Aeromonas dhakensis]|nr:hypothetical protein KBAD45_20630 [Aeromonas dhakensis]CAD7512900.1 hypothetical protein KBAD59_25080 [Aeromonas dhakensis]CAD7513742.1 hypothetical protein KBAD11_25040 [Aeromonas dhakensis]CAD7517228.1 hypothetical protein KBAD03_14940 [Aeromonas dhakensis]CAD7525677.1 hypothetical protein KBAD04_20600 [Aeromonas dhakensis]